jgi:hypothetical protein
MRRALALLAALALSLPGAAQATVTKTPVGTANCATAATSCTGTFTTSIAAGSIVEIEVMVDGLAQSYVFSITDNAGNTYTGPASGGKTTLANYNNASLVMGYTLSTIYALTSSSTFTVTTSGSTFPFAVSAYVLTGVSGIDSVSTAVNGTWTSGSANTFATTPTMRYSSDYADAIIGAVTYPTDTLGSYSGGFSSVNANISAGANRPSLFISGQTMTSGTATLVATPSSGGSARTYTSVIIMWRVAGSVRVGCGGCSGLMGI